MPFKTPCPRSYPHAKPGDVFWLHPEPLSSRFGAQLAHPPWPRDRFGIVAGSGEAPPGQAASPGQPTDVVSPDTGRCERARHGLGTSPTAAPAANQHRASDSSVTPSDHAAHGLHRACHGPKCRRDRQTRDDPMQTVRRRMTDARWFPCRFRGGPSMPRYDPRHRVCLPPRLQDRNS